MREDLLKGLSEEQIEKVKGCKNAEEILALAKAEGVELTDEQLEAVSGGGCAAGSCPECNSQNTVIKFGVGFYGKCNDCGCEWFEI